MENRLFYFPIQAGLEDTMACLFLCGREEEKNCLTFLLINKNSPLVFQDLSNYTDK